MSIAEMSQFFKTKMLDHLDISTQDNRTKLQALRQHQLDLSSTSIAKLTAGLKTKDPEAFTKSVEAEIKKKAAEVQKYIESGDIPGIRKIIPKYKESNVHVDAPRTVGGKELGGFTTLLFSFDDIVKIQDYIYKKEGTKTKHPFLGTITSGGYDFTPYLHKGHIMGLVTEQFGSVERELKYAIEENMLTGQLGDPKVVIAVHKLLRVVYEYLREQDVLTSYLPGATASDKLDAAMKRTAKIPRVNVITGNKYERFQMAVLVESQLAKGNVVSGAQAGTDKGAFKKAYRNIFENELKVALPELEEFLDTLSSSGPVLVEEAWQKTIKKNYEDLKKLTQNSPGLVDDLLKMRGSPSLKDVMISRVVAAITKNAAKNLNLSEYTVNERVAIKQNPELAKYRQQLKKQMADVKKMEAEIEKAAKKQQKAAKDLASKLARIKVQTDKTLRAAKSDALSPTRLKYLINVKLRPRLISNMGKPELTNRTGRFASSAVVTGILNRQGALEVFYTYMKYPYQTFEPGFKQGQKGYDPRRVIERSIREVAVTLTKSRFKLTRQ